MCPPFRLMPAITQSAKTYTPTKTDSPMLIAQKLIMECVNRGILDMNHGGLQFNSDAMMRWMKETNYNPKKAGKSGMKLMMACPASTYFAVAEQEFDGSRNWEANKELIDWLRKQPGFEFLKEFPNAGREAKEIV